MKVFLKKLGDKIEKSYQLSLWKWIIMCFGIAFGEELLLEILGRRSFINTLLFIINSPFAFLYNILIVFLTLTIALLSRKRAFVIAFIFFLWLGCGIVNFIVLGYRITPFSAIDLLMAIDVLSMINIYFNIFQQILMLSLIIIAIVIAVFAYIKTPKIKGRINYVKNILVCLVTFIVVYVTTFLGIKTSFISDDFANLGTAYTEFGFAYCFSNSVIDIGISKPENYGKEEIDEMLSDISSEYRIGYKKRPNIIVVQLESFIDMDRVAGVNMDKDPVPNFNALAEKYPSGYLTVPSIGAGTANTEFEILTGMNSKLFGAGEYPYKTVLTSTPVESMAQLLNKENFTTHAIHNNKGTFYSRNEVYKNMGFDTFTSLEYMYDVQYTETGWAKDDVLVSEIKKCLDSTEGRDFVFTVSVQGHGRYPTEEMTTEKHVNLTREDGNIELQNQFEYFVNQTYEMDQMIGNLVDMLDASGEKYVLVLYGDHIPSLEFEEGQIIKGTEFQTEYVIVNNIGLDLQDQDLYSYELPDVLFSQLNLQKGYMEKLHSRFFDADDTDILKEKSHIAQYDMLYGDRYLYKGKELYQASDMKMGIDTISISSVKYVDGELIVKGENFNEFSNVFINDKRLQTEYVDRQTLKVLEDDVKDEPVSEDVFCVKQMDSGKHILGSSEIYIY